MCCYFECPFIFWSRFCGSTFWKNMSRLSTAVACAFSQFNFCTQLACDSSSVVFSSFSSILFYLSKCSYFEVLRSFFCCRIRRSPAQGVAFSTRHLIRANCEVLSQLSQPIFLSFSYLNKAQHNLVIELCCALQIL